MAKLIGRNKKELKGYTKNLTRKRNYVEIRKNWKHSPLTDYRLIFLSK